MSIRRPTITTTTSKIGQNDLSRPPLDNKFYHNYDEYNKNKYKQKSRIKDYQNYNNQDYLIKGLSYKQRILLSDHLKSNYNIDISSISFSNLLKQMINKQSSYKLNQFKQRNLILRSNNYKNSLSRTFRSFNNTPEKNQSRDSSANSKKKIQYSDFANLGKTSKMFSLNKLDKLLQHIKIELYYNFQEINEYNKKIKSQINQFIKQKERQTQQLDLQLCQQDKKLFRNYLFRNFNLNAFHMNKQDIVKAIIKKQKQHQIKQEIKILKNKHTINQNTDNTMLLSLSSSQQSKKTNNSQQIEQYTQLFKLYSEQPKKINQQRLQIV